MTVTPVHRCPGGLVRVQSGPERYPSTNHLAGYSGVLQADAYGVTGRYTNPAE
ncbi:cytochrome o ubiquinol oxidase, subunit I [Escherichia coli DEC1A]|nr:cytochrome o ubiquinol oxidase, subunit I [Escherichia coli DEC1A]